MFASPYAAIDLLPLLALPVYALASLKAVCASAA
jgi:hypothetical protein